MGERYAMDHDQPRFVIKNLSVPPGEGLSVHQHFLYPIRLGPVSTFTGGVPGENEERKRKGHGHGLDCFET